MGIWTQTDVDQLKAAIVSGVLRVRYDGPPAREVMYQSTREMLTVLAIAQQSVRGGATHKFIGTNKGFSPNNSNTGPGRGWWDE